MKLCIQQKTSRAQAKINMYAKAGHCDPYQGEKSIRRNKHREDGISRKDINTVVINMLHTLKGVKETRNAMRRGMEDTFKELSKTAGREQTQHPLF